jgi:hypothetical protein
MKPRLSVLTLEGGLRLVLWPARSLARDAAYFQDPDDYLWEIVWNPASVPADREAS